MTKAGHVWLCILTELAIEECTALNDAMYIGWLKHRRAAGLTATFEELAFNTHMSIDQVIRWTTPMLLD